MIGRLIAWLRLNVTRSVLCDIPAWPSEGRTWVSAKIEFSDISEVALAGHPRLEPYARLAPVYDAYAGTSWWCAQYASYLQNLVRYHRRPLASLLDLGCGSGQFVMRFANRVPRVVGLDSNTHMLAVARKRWNDLPNVSFVEGDIRTFALDTQFDAIICASDALNYAQSPAELEQMLVQIGQHLHPGGLFVCDVLPDRFRRAMSGKFLHYESPRARFVMSFQFDPATSREQTRVIWPEGIEYHDRIAIDYEWFAPIIESAGMKLVDHFTGLTGRSFYAMERPLN